MSSRTPSAGLFPLNLVKSSLFICVLSAIACAGGEQVQAGSASQQRPDSAALSLQRHSREEVTVLVSGKEVAVHHSGDALDKSYIHPLWTPDGRIITYDAPADHVHHRGLSVGWPDVSGVDFWAEVWAPKGQRGKIARRNLATDILPGGEARIQEFNDWQTEDSATLLREERTWTFLPPRGNLQLADVEIKLTAVAEQVIFGSDPEKPREYHGLTLRMGPFEQPRFFNSAGDVGDEQCHGKPAKWCALSGIQSGRPVTAAILDHPSNDCHPTRFFVLGRGMQFISSSPNFAKPRVLKSGETWRLRYRVVAAGAPPEGKEWDMESLWKELVK
ncbi:MAG: PmoA family protein [bacterium]|nr:PmoA family protein [bacterium]